MYNTFVLTVLNAKGEQLATQSVVSNHKRMSQQAAYLQGKLDALCWCVRSNAARATIVRGDGFKTEFIVLSTGKSSVVFDL